MDKYGYAEIVLSHFVYIFSSQEEIVEDVLRELQAIIPTAVADRMAGLSGHALLWRLDGLENRDSDAWVWAIERFCARGWEPFMVQGSAFNITRRAYDSSTDTAVMRLRHREEAQ